MSTTTAPHFSDEATALPAGRLRPAVAGLVAVGAALAAAEPVVGLRRSAVSPVVAVGGWVIDHVPAGVKTFAIRQFGTNDKQALQVGIVVVLALVAVALGYGARRRPWVGAAGAALFGLAGAAAAWRRPGAGVIDAVAPSLFGALAAALVLRLLLFPSSARSRPAAPVADGSADASAATSIALAPLSPGGPATAGTGPASIDARPTTMIPSGPSGLGRRQFLVRTAGVAAVGVAAGGAGRVLQRRHQVGAARSRIVLPSPASPAPPRPDGMDLGVAGVEPFVTPNADFYRIDTALVAPQVQPDGWRLRLHGMVDRPRTFTYDDLLKRRLVERDITLVCVSNEVGGHYAGTARWLGVPLAELLREAGVKPGADQLVSRSVDGFTAGTPVATVLDGRDALVAVAMNGEPLPVNHGFPARLIVPGLYGYVSATKWLSDLELTRFADFDAYWARRGWAAQASIKTMARIDTPRGLSSQPAGRLAVAGVAWAPHTGITGVEVRIDDGPWQPARLGTGPTADTWRQWVLDWDATPGRHSITARAVDGSGVTQTDERRPPMPDGASGWHSVVVLVN